MQISNIKYQKSKIQTKYIKIFTFLVCVLYSLFFIFGFISYIFAQEIKPANVAGTFYPDNPEQLSRQIDTFMNKADLQEAMGIDILALISPHAGYEYSGQVASYGYKAIKDKKYDTVIIIAPSHHRRFKDVAIWPKGVFQTPLAVAPVDEDLSFKLMQLNPGVKSIPEAFLNEHSLEVQLPFLQKVLKEFKIVPLIISEFNLSTCQLLAHSLTLLAKYKKCLVIASTDLSHYYPYTEANRIDKLTLSYIENLDAQGLYRQAELGNVEACGLGPVLTCIFYAQELGLKAKVLKYANSGDTTLDYSRVVGYSSIAMYKEYKKEGETAMLNKEQRKRLLEIARNSIETYLKTDKKLELKGEQDSILLKERGAFVTLRQHGQLRGCIGNLTSDKPLYLTVRDMAVEAAVDDPRFSPVQLTELKDIEIELSVLSPLERIDDPDKVQLGIHGVLVRQGSRTGVFLPQVADETGWSKVEFLSNLCSHKAGLSSDAWKDKSTEIYIFTAEVFSEKNF